MTGGLEYSLILDTGEELHVLELDSETCPGLRSADVRSAISHVLERCTYAPRHVLEEAKNGFCGELQRLLSTPPIGCLLRMAEPECALLRECGIADRTACTARNVSRRGGRFPVCWEVRLSGNLPGWTGREARDLGSRIVHAWRDGRHAVIVRPS